jgi:hypothetical protein
MESVFARLSDDNARDEERAAAQQRVAADDVKNIFFFFVWSGCFPDLFICLCLIHFGASRGAGRFEVANGLLTGHICAVA